MNVLEVQDALKDFSQEQLIKEMQMPSGQAPQFLVLSELNRRQRMKQDFEARQAQQQPTVAEKLVAAAGAPQGGIGAMAQSMAPQTDMAMNTGITQMQEPMSGEVMGMQGGGLTGGTPMFYIGNTRLGTGGTGFSTQDLIDMAAKQGLSPQEYEAKLLAADIPIRPLSGGMTFTQAVNALNQRNAGAGQTAQTASYQPSGGGRLFGMSAQAATLNEPTEEDDEGSFLDSVGDFFEDRYFEDDGDFDLSQAAFDAGLAALSFSPIGLAGRTAVMGARALPGLLRGQTVKEAPGIVKRLLQKGFTKERKIDRPIPTTGSAPRTEVFKERAFSPMRTAQTAGTLGVVGGILGEDRGGGVPPAGEDDKNKGAGAGADAGRETTQDRIMDLLEKRQKSADMDKYLALAQAGFTLMQPTEGGFGEALGKAGVAGVQAYQKAEDRYQKGLADILDTEIALAKLGQTKEEKAETYSQIIDRLSKSVELGVPGAQEAQKGYIGLLQQLNKAGIAV